MKKVPKAKPSNNIVSGPKPFPPTQDDVRKPFDMPVSFAGPGVNVKTSKSYKKGK